MLHCCNYRLLAAICRHSLAVNVLRLALRPYLASLLLLCLLRTLLPGAWILALHNHDHTTTELVQASRSKGKVFLSTKHTHCHTEQFYHVPFRPEAPVAVPLPPLRLSYQPLAVPRQLACSAVALRRSALRGPPVA